MKSARSAACVSAALVVMIAALGAAQPHTGSYLSVGSSITRIDDTGVVTTLFDNPGICHGVTMDVDNRSAWFGHTFSMNQSGLFKLDLVNNAVTTVLFDPYVTYGPRDLAIDGDGDLVFTSESRTQSNPTVFRYRLFKLSGQSITTILTAPATSRWFGGLEIDIVTGYPVIQDRRTSGPIAPLFSVDGAGLISTIATSLDPRYSISQDPLTGDWYSGSYSEYLVVRNRQTPTTVTPVGSAVYYAMALDRASAASPRIVSQNGDTLYYTDLATASVSTVQLQASTGTRYELEFFRGRNLATVRTGTARWAIRVSFPNEPGDRYLVAAGLAGTTPAIPVGDGRVIPLAFDSLVALTSQNLVRPLFDPGPRVLDSNGEATGSIDLSSLPSLGIPIHLVAITLSATGIQTIADPIVLRL